MLSVSSMVSDIFSSICPGMMPKSLRLILTVERMTRKSPLRAGAQKGNSYQFEYQFEA